MRRLVAFAVAVTVFASACASSGAADRIVVAAGTTVVDSGLVDELIAAYRRAYPSAPRFSVVAAGSTEVLALGERGAADLLISHLPAAEERFVADHPQAEVRPIFASRFVLVGPPGQGVVPSGTTPIGAFTAIAAAGARFVSRADRSGTHERERDIWRRVGIDPTGRPWYLETGQGMGFTLQVADQRGAFTLSELGAFRRASGTLGLVVVELRDPERLLANPYRAIVVDPAATPAASAFVEWLAGPNGRSAIVDANQELFAEVVYAPDPGA